ncbi:hypothetical protein BV898_12710 [Hypsibius exemplaris]|uniref:Cation/H+ exchanger transmembrane domain-containing protein n=1 Tax=Hypsibius exemplaris TaxID=2072580 RepID=A0A1W0WD23_HYPEX|nr:hypothetical protein BV898_12710 [Hypsibius exemplaris]
MLFSAVVSASDPIAAVALLKEAGSSKTLTTVLEGTSLLSDTSAVVLTKLFRKLADTETVDPTGSDIAIAVFKNILGGRSGDDFTFPGLGVGFLLTSLLSRVSSVWKAELILIVVTPVFGCFGRRTRALTSAAHSPPWCSVCDELPQDLHQSRRGGAGEPDLAADMPRFQHAHFQLGRRDHCPESVAMSNKDDDEPIIPISAHDLLDLFISTSFSFSSGTVTTLTESYPEHF